MLNRIQHPQESDGSIAIALAGKSHGHPRGGMRVLAAVFPHAGRVTLDVTNIGGGFVERRSEEQNQIIGFTHKLFLQRSQRDVYAIRVACAGNGSPALRERIDAAFGVLPGSERRAIVKVSPAIPCSVPSLSVDGLCELGGAGATALRFVMEFAQGEQFCEISKDTNFKPGEPDALALTAQSNPVEAVVPIASSDQRESMRTGGGRARDGAAAMLKQRTLRGGGGRNREAFRLLGLEWFGFEERDYLIENGCVAI